MKAKDPDITQAYLRSIIDYDSETGVFTWRERGPEMFPNATPRRSSANQAACFNSAHAGKPAGTKDRGYVSIRIPGKSAQTLAHRVAWFWVYGEWPDVDIDHIDQNRSNNRISNLRLATRAQNQMNRSHRKDNKLGVRGVYYKKGRFIAEIRHNGRKQHIGVFATVEEASSAYTARARELHGEFIPST